MKILKNAILSLIIFSPIFAESEIPSLKSSESIYAPELNYLTSEEPPSSYRYLRLGACTFTYIPVGGEVAVGLRNRSENWGWGPLVNVSGSVQLKLSVASLKYEGLYFPTNWAGGYFGAMGGIGLMFGAGRVNPEHPVLLVPSLEFVLGKENTLVSGKKTFYYLSFTPMRIFSFNLGFGF